MAILLGEGDKLQCIFVVVVERFQSETIYTFTCFAFTFTVKCIVNYILQHIGQNTNYKTWYNKGRGNVKCTVQHTVMHEVQPSVQQTLMIRVQCKVK